MAGNSRELQKTPREALEAYIIHLEKSYYKWYERSVFRNYYFWLTTQLVSLVAGFGTALFAALINKDELGSFQMGRIVLIVLPVIGSLASTVLIQSRVHERWKLREEGRIQFQSLVTDGRRMYASAKSDEEWSSIHLELQNKTEEIEKAQSLGFFSNSPNFVRN